MATRYNSGWLIPNQVLALTHFVPDVTQEDFMSIASDSSAALENNVADDFYVLIDNRIILNTQLAPLAMMLQAAPYMNHPNLRQVIMIIPEAYDGGAETILDQQEKGITLTHVDTLEQAYEVLGSLDTSLNWDMLDKDFFKQE
jgi:hypothetical protein